jgi:hypothetical protein
MARAARFRKGVLGLWDRVSGRTGKIRKQNEQEAQEAALRDARERDALVAGQLSERRGLQQDLRQSKRETAREAEELRQDIAFYMGLRRQSAKRADAPLESRSRKRGPSRPPAGPVMAAGIGPGLSGRIGRWWENRRRGDRAKQAPGH